MQVSRSKVAPLLFPVVYCFYGDTKLIGEKGNISQDTSVLPLTKLYLFLTDTTEAILSP